MTLITMIGSGVPSTVLSFGAAAVVASAVVLGLLVATAAILIVADACAIAPDSTTRDRMTISSSPLWLHRKRAA